ncbi:hypothetical protein [Salinicoccus roseus]|uniref:hypothetical protein n=1 Tax=Salinicoccus roseus TaxID=45670 RepID=UPI003DA076DC
MIDERALRALIKEVVKEALAEQNGQVYEGFADMPQFLEISGISRHDMEEKLMPHPQFKQHVYRLDGRKRYIDIKPALGSIRKIMKELN